MYYNKKYQDFIDDNFFVIDSNNCKNIESKLYGFVIQENNIIAFKKNYNKHIEKKEYGNYINILKENNTLIIEQDAIGCYGLFLYKNDNYFALSNSFFYLVLYLVQNKKLTIDFSYLKYLMAQVLTSLSITRTPIKEISQLDKDIQVIIDTNTATIDFKRDKLQKHIYPIDSKESFEILDKWFSKYCSLIQSLYHADINVETTLSGGKDSRAVLTLFYHLNLLSKINVETSEDQSAERKADYNIASQIAKQYHFQLNNKENTTAQNKFSSELDLMLIFMMQLGTHKEFYFLNSYFTKPSFCFGGLGGEALRNTWADTHTQENFMKKYIWTEPTMEISRNYQTEIIGESFNYLKQITNENPGSELYAYTRNKMHAGKAMALFLLKNSFSINPFTDPHLQLINTESNSHNYLLLFSIIYQRYMPGVIDIPFDKDQIEKAVIKQADAIQKKYPKHIEIKDNFIIDMGERVIPEPENENFSQTPQEILSALFNSKEIKNFSSCFFNDKLYTFCNKQEKNTIMWMNHSDPNTLVSLYILFNTVLTHSFDFNSYLHPIPLKENSPSKKLALTTLKFLTYQILTLLFSQSCLKSIIGPSLLNKLKNKQEKYYDKLLPLLDNLSFK